MSLFKMTCFESQYRDLCSCPALVPVAGHVPATVTAGQGGGDHEGGQEDGQEHQGHGGHGH